MILLVSIQTINNLIDLPGKTGPSLYSERQRLKIKKYKRGKNKTPQKSQKKKIFFLKENLIFKIRVKKIKI